MGRHKQALPELSFFTCEMGQEESSPTQWAPGGGGVGGGGGNIPMIPKGAEAAVR